MARDPQLRFALSVVTAFIAALWLLKAVEIAFAWPLAGWGIYPRSWLGLRGIVLAPLLHGSWLHLFANTLPLLVLGTALLYGYPRARWRTLLVIWLVSGVGVWLFARPSVHLGASGLAHGAFFFLFVIGILRRDQRAMALLMIAFFLYGSMLLTVLPWEPGVSFEAHAFGALGGVLSAFWFRHREPAPAQPVYAWELEDDDEQETTER